MADSQVNKKEKKKKEKEYSGKALLCRHEGCRRVEF